MWLVFALARLQVLANGGARNTQRQNAGHPVDRLREAQDRPVVGPEPRAVTVGHQRIGQRVRDHLAMGDKFPTPIAGKKVKRLGDQPAPRALVPQTMRSGQNFAGTDHRSGTEPAQTAVHPADRTSRIVAGVDDPAVVLALDAGQQLLA